MSIRAVENAIRKVREREMVEEWDAVGYTSWQEVHPKYAVVYPIVRALGWDTDDPKECHSEFPRPYPSGWADYAFFGAAEVLSIVNDGIPPDVIIESK